MAARSTTPASLTPRLTTGFTLIGPSPAAAAAAIPSSTRDTGTPASFIAWKIASSRESRLTVTRCSPAAAKAAASRASRLPLVVIVRSSRPPMPASIAIGEAVPKRGCHR
jgi:hypothetical protein